MVAPQVLVALHLPPWDAERGDHRSRVRLVLVRQQQGVAAVMRYWRSRICGRGIVDLVQDAGGDGEPDRTARRVRRADRVLRALRPSRCDAGGTPKARFAARRIGMSYAPACRSMGPASGPAVPPAPRVQGGGSL